MGRRVPLPNVRPTQLYLSREKLVGVLEWFDVDSPTYEPLPAFEHEGEWYLADGHTRAFAAALGGAETICLERDDEVRDLYDFDVYLKCIEWCRQEGVDTVHDLHGRVLEPDTYQRRWLDRCQAVSDAD